MEILQFRYKHGSIPVELGCIILILIPKVNSYNQGIGILEVLWKVVEAIIDKCIKNVVTFHDVLHGFCSERGMGTAIIELKLVQ